MLLNEKILFFFTSHHQLTNLPAIYLTAASVGNDWTAAGLECYDSQNKLSQGTEWTNTAVSIQYQGSGGKDSKDSYRLKQQLMAWYISQEVLCIYKGFNSVEAYRSITSTATDQKLHRAVIWDSQKSLGNNSTKHPVTMDDLETPYSRAD